MCYAGKPVTAGHEGRPTDTSKRIPKAEVVDLVLQNHPHVGYNDIGGL